MISIMSRIAEERITRVSPGEKRGVPPQGLWSGLLDAGEVVRPPSFYSAGIDTFDNLPAAGIGIATGMIAGTTGLEGSARGRMAILAGIIGAVLATRYLDFDGAPVIGALVGAIAAVLSTAVVSDVIVGPSGGAARQPWQ